MKKIRFRKLVGKIHLWTGFTVGSIIFIIALTGAIYAFEEEIRYLLEKDSWYVNSPGNQNKITLSELRQKAKATFFNSSPGIKDVEFESVTFSKDPERSVSFYFYNSNPLVYKEIVINPYSGEVLYERNFLADFFFLNLELHRNLLLGPIGKEIIDYACLIFLFMLITGIILWWPRSAAAKKQRFSIKWNLHPKRVNYDLHNVLGFYASWIAVFLVLTGFVWAFTWFSSTVDWIANGGETSPHHKEFVSDTLQTDISNKPVADIVFDYSQNKPWDTKRFWLGLPVKKTDYYNLVTYYSEKTYYKHEHTAFDQYSGNIIEDMPYDESTNGDKILAMAYDIHIGKILGLPGQILVFFASIIVASLPVTGLRIWIGRKKRKSS